jgi:hypothetical protein
MSPRRRRLILTIAAALGGSLLFAWAVRRAGTAEILDGIRRVGWGLIPILALGGVRFAIRAEAWRFCAPPGHRLPFRQAFSSFLAGDAIGNITPLGLIASEPAKVFLTRRHLDTRDSISSLAVDNLIYAASVIAMITGSGAVMLATVPLPFEWQEWVAVAIAALLFVVIGVTWVVRRGGGASSGPPSGWLPRIAQLRNTVMEFSAGHPLRLSRAFALDMLFHAVAVFEAWLTLRWLLGSASPTFTQALIFEALSRVMKVAFKFVPFRVGVDEASSGALAPLLAVNPVTGVSLAIVRKVRDLFWAGIGVALIAVHHVRAEPAPDRHETAPVPRT